MGIEIVFTLYTPQRIIIVGYPDASGFRWDKLENRDGDRVFSEAIKETEPNE
ncbi:hypothetical protein HORM4_660136 [Vibrio harveyi]|nr:hypothetical protein HORM4_660136 [Vibrio harveyi]